MSHDRSNERKVRCCMPAYTVAVWLTLVYAVGSATVVLGSPAAVRPQEKQPIH